ncbi:MAG: CoA transferase [Phenylobacterium sp.]
MNREPSALPLAGIRVLELGRWYAAPWASQMLADLGAEVIKVESQQGDPMRQSGFLVSEAIVRDGEGNPTSDHSSFITHNRNKSCLVVDLGNPEGQKLVRDLAATADVFIENFKPGDLARRGLDYAAISKINPEIIYLSLSGYGQTGPYREKPAMDGVAQAFTGFASLIGPASVPPSLSPVPVCDFAAGMYAAVALLGALYGRDAAGGKGQHIDLALIEAGLGLMSLGIVPHLLTGKAPERGRLEPLGAPNVFQAQDGYLYIGVNQDEAFKVLCEAAGLPDLPGDPRFSTFAARLANGPAMIEEVSRGLAHYTRAEWVQILEPAGLLCTPVNRIEDVVNDPHVIDRGMIRQIPHVAGGTIPVVRNPIRYSETPLERFESPRLLGQDTAEVLSKLLGVDSAEVDRLRASGAFGR